MADITRVIESLLIDRLSGDASAPAIRNGVVQGVLIALTAFFVVLGFGFVMYGVYLTLHQHFSPQIAAIVTGIIYFGFAAAMAIGVTMVLASYRARSQHLRQGLADKTKAMFASLDNEFGDAIRANPQMAVIVASVAGFLLEKRIV